MQVSAAAAESSDEDNAKPSAFKALLSSLSTSQYSSEEEEDDQEEDDQEEDDQENDDQENDDQEEDSQEEEDSQDEDEDFEIPETLRRSLQASGEDDDSDDDDSDDEDDLEEEGDALVETTHPFSLPPPSDLAKVHETFECETNNPEEPQSVYSLSGHVPVAPARSHLKSRLKLTWEQYQDAKSRGDSALVDKLSPLISNYSDVMFESRDLFNAAELREMYAVHVCNHLFTYRDLVIRHDAKRASAGDAPVLRDQGFTRPRILVLLPYKSSCFRFVKLLIELFPNKTRVKNLDRFVEEFGPEGEEEEGEEDKPAAAVDWRAFQRHCKSSESYTELDFAERTHPGMTEAEAMGKPPKPADWHASFEENADEDFRLGVSMLGPKSLKLYSGFYESDLIVASPLGLRLATKQAMETQGEEGGEDNEDEELVDEINEDEVLDVKPKKSLTRKQQKKAKDQEEDVDFLSSIEILIMDEADVFHTQNWQHLEDVCRGLNRRPKVLRKGMDLARVYSHLLPSKAKPQRQTLVFSAFPDAQLHALVARERRNALAVVVRPQSYVGASLFCETGLVQRFRQVESGEARFDHFANQVISKLLDNEQGQTLLFVPDYLEFVRIRNAFKQQAARRQPRGGDKTKKQRTSLFECISEYSSASKVARAKSLFFHNKTRVLIVTERLQYYYRYRIRGIGRLVMYAPPQHAHFYTELCLLTRDEAVTFYTPLEALELERVLGTARARKALRGSNAETVVVCE